MHARIITGLVMLCIGIAGLATTWGHTVYNTSTPQNEYDTATDQLVLRDNVIPGHVITVVGTEKVTFTAAQTNPIVVVDSEGIVHKAVCDRVCKVTFTKGEANQTYTLIHSKIASGKIAFEAVVEKWDDPNANVSIVMPRENISWRNLLIFEGGYPFALSILSTILGIIIWIWGMRYNN